MNIIKPGVIPDEVKYRIPDYDLLWTGTCPQCGCEFEIERVNCDRVLVSKGKFKIPATVAWCPTDGCSTQVQVRYKNDQPTYTNGFVPKPEPKPEPKRSLFQRIFNPWPGDK